MATQTPFLGLTLPGLGEYTDSWDVPINGNFEDIDSWAQATGEEIVNARFGKASLKAFLEVGHETSGNLKAQPETIKARNSAVYGDFEETNPGATFDALSKRLAQVDLEVHGAREGEADLKSALARRVTGISDFILSGSKDSNGFPTWLSAAGKEATVNGATTPVWMMVGGKACRVRTNKSAGELSGGTGWYYLYAEYQPTGVETASGTGTTTTDTLGKKRIFQDTTKIFTGPGKDVDVEVGDILTLTGTSDAGTYFIKALGYDGDNSSLEIVGLFADADMPGASSDYTIHDPHAVTLGYTATKTAVDGRIYIGEVYYDGTAIITTDPATPLRPYHFKDTYVGNWRYFDVSGGTHVQTEIWEHRLGSDILDFSVQVSQANDGSAPIEELSLAGIKNTLSVSIGTPISVDVDYTPGTAGGDPVTGSSVSAEVPGPVSASVGGNVVPSRSAMVKWTRNQVFVKNAVSQLLYTDFDGTERQTGYVRVVVRKRG